MRLTPILLLLLVGCVATTKKIATSGPADIDQSTKLVDAAPKNTGTLENLQQGGINVVAGSSFGAALGWFIRDIVNSVLSARRDGQELQMQRETIAFLFMLGMRK